MGSKRERAPGKWELRVFAGRDPLTGKDRQVSRTFRGGARAADKALRELEAEVDAGHALSGNVTFGELLDRWMRHRWLDWEATTRDGYSAMVRTHLSAISEVRLDKLRAHHLDSLYMAMRETGYKPATVSKVHRTAHTALQQAVRWGLIPTNPAVMATRPTVGRRPPTAPTLEQLGAVLASLADERHLFTYLRVAATTGARRSQVLGLQWADIDHDTETIRFSRAVVPTTGGYAVKGTKTDTPYAVRVDPVTLGHLKAYRAHRQQQAMAAGAGRLGERTWVFSRDLAGEEPWGPSTPTQAWRRIRTAHGLDHVRLHDVRHAVATELMGAGFGARVVADRLGQSNPATTLGVYTHAVPARDEAAAVWVAHALDGT